MLPKVKIIVAVVSPIAFEALNGADLLTSSLQIANEFALQSGSNAEVAIAAKPEFVRQLRIGFYGEIIECDPSSPSDFAKALEKSNEFEFVAIHDAQRPLTQVTQFHRSFAALVSGLDAVRPAAAFTETLKVVNQNSELTKTIDRTKVRRVSTPEVFRKNAIDFAGDESTWFLPLIAGAKVGEVDADPESLRINEANGVELMESFLVWQQGIAR